MVGQGVKAAQRWVQHARHASCILLSTTTSTLRVSQHQAAPLSLSWRTHTASIVSSTTCPPHFRCSELHRCATTTCAALLFAVKAPHLGLQGGARVGLQVFG